MAARAIWKAVIRLGGSTLPVKLYSAIQDRTIRFRLLHEPDRIPLSQRMVHPRSGEPVPHSEARRGLEIEPELFVVLTEEELAELEPEPSRDLEILRFLPPHALNPQWYDRPYYLGPDGNEARYAAFVRALADEGREGVARWAMRKKRYLGALRAEGDHLLLITLRPSDAVISVGQLEPPEGRPLSAKERTMGGKFIGALEEEFDPAAYRDRHRERVLELIERKRKGEIVEVPEYQPRERAREDLAELLEQSLARMA